MSERPMGGSNGSGAAAPAAAASLRPEELAALLLGVGTPRIAVAGDLILDRYVWGSVERISPEAPIPVLRTEREESKTGGAGSVVMNLHRLGAEVVPFGAVGDDVAGREFLAHLEAQGISRDGVVIARDGRPTTVKTRFLGGQQQLLRVDAEVTAPLGADLDQRLARAIAEEVPRASAVLLPDYDKGMLAGRIPGALVEAAQRLGARAPALLADPRRDPDYSRYRGMSAITPNRRETEIATGLPVRTIDDARAAAARLREMLGLSFVVVTLDRDGLYLYRGDAEGDRPGQGRAAHFKTRPRTVFDVTGAGDMVLSVMGFLVAGGVGVESACAIANVAGGLEVERVGVCPLARQDIVEDLLGGAPAGRGKVKTREELRAAVSELRRQGRRIVFTNGCFDLLHPGHVRYLQYSRGLGDVLIVGMNSDASVRGVKGEGRPILREAERVAMLSALASVDYVVPFGEPTPIDLIRDVQPDILVKGQDYENREVVGRDVVEAAGGRVVLAPLTEGLSTTEVVRRVLASTSPASGGDPAARP